MFGNTSNENMTNDNTIHSIQYKLYNEYSYCFLNPNICTLDKNVNILYKLFINYIEFVSIIPLDINCL